MDEEERELARDVRKLLHDGEVRDEYKAVV